ncbi:hypothetical protein Tco_0816720 [Tanacetum coccineum]
MRINPGMKPKEPTYQVAFDSLALTTCYPAFLITAEVPIIYMHQFWATVTKHKASYQFKIDNKRFSMNVEVFKEILNICPNVLAKEFDEPPTEEEALSFIRELGYFVEIRYITDVVVDHLHQRWRTFASIINKCLYGKKKSAKAKKVVATKPKWTKKNAPIKADRGKGLKVLSKVALSEADQLKEAIERSKKDSHVSHPSGSVTDEGTGTKTGVLDVPKYDSESDKKSWGDSDEEDDDEYVFKDESDDEGDDNDDDDDNDVENPKITQSTAEQEEKEYNDEKVHTSSDYELNDDENITDEEKMDEDEDDEVTKELYRDVNINLGNEDAEMTNVDQGGEEQHNVSQDLRFQQEEEDACVTLTTVHETQKTAGREQIIAIPKITSATTVPPLPSSFIPFPQQTTPTPSPINSEATTSFTAFPDFSSVFRFNDRVTSLEKTLSKMKQVGQYAKALSYIPAIVDGYISNKLQDAIQKAIESHNAEFREEALADKKEYIDLVDTLMRTIISKEVKTQLPQILPQAVLEFATPVIEKSIIESLKAIVLAKSSSQPKSKYEAVASLSEFELMKIQMDKMEETKSYQVTNYNKELYDALVKSYNIDKDLFESYGEVFSVKRGRDEKDKDHDPSAGLDRGTKRRKTRKETHLKILGAQQDQEFVTGNNDDQPADKEVSKADWFKQPERPPTPDSDWNRRQHVDFRPPQTWISQVAHAKEPLSSFDELINTPINFFAFDYFINNDLEYLKGRDLSRQYSTSVTKTKAAAYDIKWIEDLVRGLWVPEKVTYDQHSYWGISYWVTRLNIQKKYDYGNLEEIEVRRDDQKLYKFREDERSDLRNRTAYTSYFDPQGVIYVDNFDRKRLMFTDELHKFSDGTLNDVRTALHDISKGIRMEYMSKRKWSALDKKRARVMVQDIDKQLFKRRLMRNLEKFVGGQEYRNDLRLLERKI